MTETVIVRLETATVDDAAVRKVVERTAAPPRTMPLAVISASQSIDQAGRRRSGRWRSTSN